MLALVKAKTLWTSDRASIVFPNQRPKAHYSLGDDDQSWGRGDSTVMYLLYLAEIDCTIIEKLTIQRRIVLGLHMMVCC